VMWWCYTLLLNYILLLLFDSHWEDGDNGLMVSKLRWTGADHTAAAISRHFHGNLRAWKSVADVYYSPRKGTVHLPSCWINTLVMYCWFLLCGSTMVWEDVSEDCCFLCVPNLEKFRQAYTNKNCWSLSGGHCTEFPSASCMWWSR
jgi:hypothetical protein